MFGKHQKWGKIQSRTSPLHTPYGFFHYMSPSFNFLYIAHNSVELFFGQASGFSTNFRESEIENTHFLGKRRSSYALAQGFSECAGLPDIVGKYNMSYRNALKLFYFLSIGAFVCHVCTGAQHTPPLGVGCATSNNHLRTRVYWKPIYSIIRKR